MAAKRVFLAATGQNRGKTTTSLGLLAAIRDRGLRLGFVKPVGQRYLVVAGTRITLYAIMDYLNYRQGDASPDAIQERFLLARQQVADVLEGQVEGAARRGGVGVVQLIRRTAAEGSAAKAARITRAFLKAPSP